MTQTSPSVPLDAAPAPRRGDGQLRDVRFLETLKETLAGCGDEQAVCSSAVHRVARAMDVDSTCLASYDPIGGVLDVRHRAGEKRRWQDDPLLRAVQERRTVVSDDILAVPVIYHDGPYGNGRGSQSDDELHLWGILAVARVRDPETGYSHGERQTLRSAAASIAGELERREAELLNNVIDSLLRKTKPIDVYTHSLRELRRFIKYDHSASIMTMQRGIAQITVRAEKLVTLRGNRETLTDGPRRGRSILLSDAQLEWLSGREEAFGLRRARGSFQFVGDEASTAPGDLWRVLGVDETSAEGSVLCCPLVFGGQMLGILRLAAHRPEAFGAAGQYVRLLERFSRLLSVTLYRSELYHQSDRQLQAIKQIGRTITEPTSVVDVCEQVLQLALRVLHVEVGVIGLANEWGGIDLVTHRGCTLEEPPSIAVGEGIAGSVVRTGVSRAVPDVAKDTDYVVFNARVSSELVAPITYNREVIGFLDVESYEVGRFREEDEEVITFLEALANQAAIAIKTSQLHADAMKRLGATVAIDPALSTAALQNLLIGELRDKIEQLAAANEQLASANRAKSEFLARMSHDLRGPLNVIVGLANLLTDPSVGPTLTLEKQRESLNVIRSSGEVLASLIGSILDLSALEAGKVELNIAPLNATWAFDYLRSMASTLAQESKRELDISVTVDPAIRTLAVDEQKFMRIMINLLSNAIKFTPHGGSVGLTAMVEEQNDMAGGLHVVVSDSGIGIPAEHHEQIFEPFRRIESTSGQHHGTGLGLAVVRQLVDLHEGRVWVASRPGEGAQFHVVLPFALRGDEQNGDGPSDVDRMPATPEAPRRRTKGLVLVVEDTEAHMDIMRLAVTSRGYDMHGVRSGEDAITWLADNRPEVVLLDMQLPGIDGFTVASHLKSRVETNAIPLVAVTADALSINEERALASGCDAYLTKPIDLAKLLATIDTVTR